jgi:hypothetical protein
MESVKIIDVKQQSLHSLEDYLLAIKMITSIKNLLEYIKKNAIPVIADYPGQLFIRKAITLYLNNQLNIEDIDWIQNFVPMLGPLHVSLNSRECVVLIYYDFFKKLFCDVFEKKTLAKKPKPWRINLLLQLVHDAWLEISEDILEKFKKTKDVEYRMMIDLLDNIIPATLDIYTILFRSGAFEQYLETIFRIWTFFLRWKRKNYNKIPLAFLSDYFYWKKNNHPFAKLLEKSLVNFNDYFVENIHSKIRAQTNKFSSPESIIREAFIIDSCKKSPFVDAFSKNKKYPYTPAHLDYLTKKTSCFLLEYFFNIYKNLDKSEPYYKGKKLTSYKLSTLGEKVDLKLLPAGFHTAYPPKKDLCDHCEKVFDPNFPETDGCVLICGHGYHYGCYEDLEKSCRHCMEFYKRGVYENVIAFVSRLEKSSDNIIEPEDNEANEDEDEDDNSININQEHVYNLFLNLKNEIKNW